MTNDVQMNLYFLGVPTKESFVTQEHLNLIEEDNVVFVMYSNMFEEVNGYNFFKQHDFNFYEYIDVRNLLQAGTKKIIFNVSSYNPNWRPVQIGGDQQTNSLQDLLFELKGNLGDVKIVFCSYGNLFHSPRYLYDLVRRPNRPRWPTHLINTKSSDNDDIEIFYSIAGVLWGNDFPSLAYKDEETEDYSGIFFDQGMRLPSLDVTPKPIFDLMDDRAKSFANSKNLILWSGGTDSTAILAAFAKNNIPFKISVSEHTRLENPELHDYVLQNFDYITIDNTLNLTSLDSDYVVLHGGCADSLFPRCRWDQAYRGDTAEYHPFGVLSMRMFLGSNIKYKNTNYDLETAYNLALQPMSMSEIQDQHGYWEILSELLINRGIIKSLNDPYALKIKEYIDDKIAKWPLPITYFYELSYMFRFIFAYYDSANRVLQRVVKVNGNPFVDFFDTKEFQQWALINFSDNMINYTETPQREKYFLKEYAYNYFNIPSILEKTKFPSLSGIKAQNIV